MASTFSSADVYGTLAISPMFAAVSPFFMDGTEQM
jgi:hypothetical protein